jgi:hypothetical protein
MEKLNTAMENMSPHILSLYHLLVICVESFFTSVYVAGKCLFVYLNTYSLQDFSIKNLNTYSLQDFSIKNFNKIINDEIERQDNPVLSNVGVWVSMCFCVNVLWTVLVNLVFPVFWVTLWWVCVWSVGFWLKEKVGLSVLSKLKMA